MAQAILNIDFCCKGILPLEKKVKELLKTADPKNAQQEEPENEGEDNIHSGEKTDERLKSSPKKKKEEIIVNNVETILQEENINRNKIIPKIIKLPKAIELTLSDFISNISDTFFHKSSMLLYSV